MASRSTTPTRASELSPTPARPLAGSGGGAAEPGVRLDEGDMSEAPELPPSPAVIATLVAHRREFLGFLERRLGDRAAAEDLLQEAFSRLDKLASLRDEESATAWFYRVLRNASTDRARRKQSEARGLEALAAELSLTQPESGPESEVSRAVCRCVATLKDNLKPSYREALERIELDGVTVKDYAAEAGISPSNAAVRAFRARDALRKQVALACGACAEHGCLDCHCQHGVARAHE
jgi:RNA polymerase sigma factor (sigma-70 family)